MAHHIHEYKARTNWTGAGKGAVEEYKTYSREYEVAIEGKPLFTGSADPTFYGDPALHNPEDMLMIALSACHMLSYLALCAKYNIRVTAYHDDAWGKMEIADNKMRFTEVVLKPVVTIDADSDANKAAELHHEAHAQCFIASSVNFPVRNEPEIRVMA
ncbi:MAG: OsmC family peroxiredoxin [Alphaproteobacteria bacterium]|nr:MAG: OsmC family peroxiredoxin [Alphaproteobacteria bacterium]